jgi:GNAT superfamily N-acetyltransferase
MKITHYDGLNRTPALRLALVGQLELLDLGLAQPVLNVNWDNQAFVAFDEEDRPIGVLTWAHHKWSNSIDIAIGYVVPHERRQGVYRRLWDALVAKAQELKVPVIMSSTHKGNLPMRRTAMEQGRQELGVVLHFAVPPAP